MSSKASRAKLSLWPNKGVIVTGKIVRKSRRIRACDGVSPEMLPEYRFDYRKAKPNRFAGRQPSITKKRNNA
jgi:hypothetical protein